MTTRPLHRNMESGRVLILVMIFMLTLSAFWIVALSMTGEELRFVGGLSGRRAATQSFYNVEAGTAEFFDDFADRVPTSPPSAPVSQETFTYAGKTVAVEARPIRNDATYADTYRLPQQEHVFTGEGCNEGSGFETVECRRYAITARAADGREVQVGVFQRVVK